jgi:hypothetical protein
VLALGAPGAGVAAAGDGLRSVRVDASVVEGLRAELSARCDEQVRGELVAGQRRDGACGEDREVAGRAVVHRRDAFGFVEQRTVELASLRLVLGEARRCRQWPLRSPGRDVLRRTDAAAAGCRLRRYQGEVPVVLVDREGRRHEPLPPMRTDRDGRVELRFAALDQALRVLDEGTLDGYARIELGHDGWAGHVDLEQLLRFRADWHLTWLLHGRGTPGLFAARHPDHRGADAARTLATEALLARQARDYERVEAGELPARTFLARYPSSPYRRRVESLLRERAMPSRRAEHQPDEGLVGGAPAGVSEGTGAEPSAGAGAIEGPSSASGGGRRGGASGGNGP